MKTIDEELKRMKLLIEGTPRQNMTEVIVIYSDGGGHLEEIINYIGKNGNTGHSFSIVIDPSDKENAKTFFWDGDGSDHINSITVNGKPYKSREDN